MNLHKSEQNAHEST